MSSQEVQQQSRPIDRRRPSQLMLGTEHDILTNDLQSMLLQNDSGPLGGLENATPTNLLGQQFAVSPMNHLFSNAGLVTNTNAGSAGSIHNFPPQGSGTDQIFSSSAVANGLLDQLVASASMAARPAQPMRVFMHSEESLHNNNHWVVPFNGPGPNDEQEKNLWYAVNELPEALQQLIDQNHHSPPCVTIVGEYQIDCETAVRDGKMHFKIPAHKFPQSMSRDVLSTASRVEIPCKVYVWDKASSGPVTEVEGFKFIFLGSNPQIRAPPSAHQLREGKLSSEELHCVFPVKKQQPLQPQQQQQPAPGHGVGTGAALAGGTSAAAAVLTAAASAPVMNGGGGASLPEGINNEFLKQMASNLMGNVGIDLPSQIVPPQEDTPMDQAPPASGSGTSSRSSSQPSELTPPGASPSPPPAVPPTTIPAVFAKQTAEVFEKHRDVNFQILQKLAHESKEFDLQAVRLRLYVCGIVASEVIHKTNNGHHVFTKDNSKIWIIVQHPPGQALNRVHPPELYCQVQARQRGGKNLARFVPCDKVERSYGRQCRCWLYHFELNRIEDVRDVFNMRNNVAATANGRDRFFTLLIIVNGVYVQHQFTVAARKAKPRGAGGLNPTGTGGGNPNGGNGMLQQQTNPNIMAADLLLARSASGDASSVSLPNFSSGALGGSASTLDALDTIGALEGSMSAAALQSISSQMGNSTMSSTDPNVASLMMPQPNFLSASNGGGGLDALSAGERNSDGERVAKRRKSWQTALREDPLMMQGTFSSSLDTLGGVLPNMTSPIMTFGSSAGMDGIGSSAGMMDGIGSSAGMMNGIGSSAGMLNGIGSSAGMLNGGMSMDSMLGSPGPLMRSVAPLGGAESSSPKPAKVFTFDNVRAKQAKTNGDGTRSHPTTTKTEPGSAATDDVLRFQERPRVRGVAAGGNPYSLIANERINRKRPPLARQRSHSTPANNDLYARLAVEQYLNSPVYKRGRAMLNGAAGVPNLGLVHRQPPVSASSRTPPLPKVVESPRNGNLAPNRNASESHVKGEAVFALRSPTGEGLVAASLAKPVNATAAAAIPSLNRNASGGAAASPSSSMFPSLSNHAHGEITVIDEKLGKLELKDNADQASPQNAAIKTEPKERGKSAANVKIEDLPCYAGSLPRKDCAKLLHNIGDYLVRDCNDPAERIDGARNPNLFVVAYKTTEKIKSTKVFRMESGVYQDAKQNAIVVADSFAQFLVDGIPEALTAIAV